MIAKIKILNWEKHNPKRDQKTYTWLRLQNGIANDKDLFGLSAEQKWAWVVLLCEASKKNCGELEFDIEWLVQSAGVKKVQIEAMLRLLEEKAIISKSLPPAAAQCSEPSTFTTPTYERTNVRTYERTHLIDPADAGPECVILDFEILYRKYPRKLGKQKGIATCKAQIRGPEEFQALSLAIDRYAEHCRKNATEPRYIKHFSTFMHSWRDWLEAEAGTFLRLPEEEPEWVRQAKEEEARNKRDAV